MVTDILIMFLGYHMLHDIRNLIFNDLVMSIIKHHYHYNICLWARCYWDIV